MSYDNVDLPSVEVAIPAWKRARNADGTGRRGGLNRDETAARTAIEAAREWGHRAEEVIAALQRTVTTQQAELAEATRKANEAGAENDEMRTALAERDNTITKLLDQRRADIEAEELTRLLALQVARVTQLETSRGQLSYDSVDRPYVRFSDREYRYTVYPYKRRIEVRDHAGQLMPIELSFNGAGLTKQAYTTLAALYGVSMNELRDRISGIVSSEVFVPKKSPNIGALTMDNSLEGGMFLIVENATPVRHENPSPGNPKDGSSPGHGPDHGMFRGDCGQ